MVYLYTRRSILVGGGAAWAAKRIIFFQRFPKNFVLSSKLSNDLF